MIANGSLTQIVLSILRGRMHLAGGRLGDAAAESEAAIAAAAAVGADAYVSAACSLLGIITLRQGDLQAAASYVADCPVPLSSAAAVRRRLHGRARMVVDEDHGCLLGVTMIGPGVEELLHSATVAVAGQVPVSRLWHAVPAFPSVSEVWLRLLEACRG